MTLRILSLGSYRQSNAAALVVLLSSIICLFFDNHLSVNLKKKKFYHIGNVFGNTHKFVDRTIIVTHARLLRKIMLSFSRMKFFLSSGSTEIFRLVYLTLMLLVNSVAAIPNLTLEKSNSCNYLQLEEGQNNNAFYYNNHICCLCPLGTKLTTDYCNSTHPVSTVCDVCDEDEFQEFSAHMEMQCKKQIKSCSHPRKLVKGDRTRASKCVCKAGFVEMFRQCLPVSSSSTTARFVTEIMTTTSQKPKSTTSTVTQNIPTQTTHTQTTTISKSSTVELPATVILGSSTTQTDVDRPDGLNVIKPDPTADAFPLGTVAGIIAGVISLALIIVAVVIYRKNRNESGPKGNDSPTISYKPQLVDESTQVLVPGRKRTTSLTASLTCCSGINREDMVASNKAGPEHRTGVIAEDNGNGAGGRHPERVSLLGAAAYNLDLNVADHAEDEPPAEVCLHHVVPPEKMNEFVRKLANQWTMPVDLPYIGYENVKSVFRSLYEGNHDAMIDSTYTEHKGNLEEMLYVLLQDVKRNLGRRFTPRYIIGKLQNMNPSCSNLIAITEDVEKTLAAPPPNDQAANDIA